MAVITTEVGASPEKVESDVVKPMESTLGTINGVEKLTSTSANNYGMLMLEFAEDTKYGFFTKNFVISFPLTFFISLSEKCPPSTIRNKSLNLDIII